MENLFNLKYIVASIFYSFLGIVISGLVFWLIDVITPSSLFKEIFQHKNTALGIFMGAIMISVAIIIASAIH